LRTAGDERDGHSLRPQANPASGELYAGLASHAGRRHEQLVRAVLTRRGGQRQALDQNLRVRHGHPGLVHHRTGDGHLSLGVRGRRKGEGGKSDEDRPSPC
jgi:hypothetical protein